MIPVLLQTLTKISDLCNGIHDKNYLLNREFQVVSPSKADIALYWF
jgi:hypothetical protein